MNVYRNKINELTWQWTMIMKCISIWNQNKRIVNIKQHTACQ